MATAGPVDREFREIWVCACVLALVACSSQHRPTGSTPDDDGGTPDGGVVMTIPGYRLDWVVLEGGEHDTDSTWNTERGEALGVLPGGDPIVAGHFYEEAVFGEGTAHETPLVAKGENDIFLARYSPEGVLRWATSAGGPSNDYVYRLKVLRDDRVAVVGRVMGWPAVFGEGEPGEAVSIEHAGSVAFVAVYDSQDGTLEWMRNVLYASYTDCPTCSSNCDAVDELAGGEIIVACGYDGPVSVCPPESDEPLPYAPTEIGGGAVLTFSPDGELIDHMLPDGNLTHYGATIDLRVRSNGGYYLAGSYAGVLSFGSHHLWQVEAAGDSSIFGASFDAAGALEWLVDLGFDGTAELPQWASGNHALAKETDDFILSARYSGAWTPAGEAGAEFQTGEDMTEGALIALGHDGQTLWWRTTRFECNPETEEYCGSPNTELRGAVVAPYGDLLVPGNSMELWRWDDVAIGVGGEGVEMLAERTAGNSVIPNGFVSGFSSDGDVAWVSPAVSHSDDPTTTGRFLLSEMAFDSEDNLYIAGGTYRRSTFGYGAIDAVELESVGYGIVLLRYSPIEPPE